MLGNIFLWQTKHVVVTVTCFVCVQAKKQNKEFKQAPSRFYDVYDQVHRQHSLLLFELKQSDMTLYCVVQATLLYIMQYNV